MLQNDAQIKNPSKGKDKTVDFKLTEYKMFIYQYGFRFHIEIKV